MGAASTKTSPILLATIGILGLSGRMIGMDVHGEMEVLMDRSEFLSCYFIGCRYCLRIPVRPVHCVLEEGKGKWVWQVCAEDLISITAIQIGAFDGMLLGIRPVDLAVGKVNC